MKIVVQTTDGIEIPIDLTEELKIVVDLE